MVSFVCPGENVVPESSHEAQETAEEAEWRREALRRREAQLGWVDQWKLIHSISKVKLSRHADDKGERSIALYSWPQHYMGMSGQRHASAALYPGKGPPVPNVQGAGWTPEPVWTKARGKMTYVFFNFFGTTMYF
jgi:hypothetical protein